MSKQKMQQARELIQAERFDEAREILKTVDHPTAIRWLEHLDQIAPEKRIVVETRRGNPLIFVFIGLVIVALVVVAVAVLPGMFSSGDNSAALQTQTSNSLAIYFPAGTTMYASLRIDDAQIAEIDALVSKIVSRLPSEIIPPGVTFSLSSLLDQRTQQSFGTDFQTSIRSWLGDNLAVGLTNSASLVANDPANIGFYTVAEITSKENLIRFIESTLSTPVTRTEESGYTIFTTGNQSVAVGDSLVFVGTDKAAFPLNGLPNPNLMADADFTSSMSLLTAPTYSGIFYINISSFLNSVYTTNPDLVNTSPGQSPELTEALLKVRGQQIMGLTLLDNHSVVLDIANNNQDVSALRELGFSLDGTGAVDPSFLARIPANAGILFQMTDLKTLYTTMVQMSVTSNRLNGMTVNDPQLLYEQFQAMTGINVQEEVLPLLDGDIVLYAPQNLASASMTSEVALVIEVTDPPAAQAFVEKIAGVVTQLGSEQEITATREIIGNANALVIQFRTGDSQFGMTVEVVLAANTNVLVFGTRAAATDSLLGLTSIITQPHFSAARHYILPNATSVLFVDSKSLSLTGILAASMGTSLVQQQQTLSAILDSASFSTAANAEGDGLARLVITFAE